MARGDAAGAARHAHGLRGSSASLGAEAMAARCHALEQAARERRVEALPALLEGLQAEFVRVRAALAATRG